MPSVDSTIPELDESDPSVHVYRTTGVNRVLNMVPAGAAFAIGLAFYARAPSAASGLPIFAVCTLVAVIWFALRYNTAFHYGVTFTPDKIQVQYGRRRTAVRRNDVVGVRRLQGSQLDGPYLRLETKDGKGVDILSIIGPAPELKHWTSSLEDLSARDSIWNHQM